MKFHPPPPCKKARLEIIPLIDVIFFLLATFVLVSLSMTRIQGIPLDLPVGRAAAAPDENETRSVGVLRGGQYVWDQQALSWEQLLVKLAQYRRESPDPRVLIQGESEAEFGHAAAVLDEARRIGISKVSIQTQIKPIDLGAQL